MASREEEKRRRREARLAAERQAAAQARRTRMLRWGGASVVAVALAVGVVVAVTSGGGSSANQGSAASAGSAKPVPLPPPKEANLQAAAREAGCAVRSFPDFGREHTTGVVKYKTNPPTSGPHYPQPAQDGAYSPGNPPPVTQSVHSLEHGRIEFQWKPGTPARVIGQLQSLFNEQGGYHALLFENQTHMPYTVAATAWRHLIGCRKLTTATWDALRDFRKAYTDKAPEQIP